PHQDLRLGPQVAGGGRRPLTSEAEGGSDRAQPQHMRPGRGAQQQLGEFPALLHREQVAGRPVEQDLDDSVRRRGDPERRHHLGLSVATPPYKSTSSGAVRMVTARTLVKSLNDSQPPSRPIPLSRTPPQGEDGSRRWWSLIHTMPVSSRPATRWARA